MTSACSKSWLLPAKDVHSLSQLIAWDPTICLKLRSVYSRLLAYKKSNSLGSRILGTIRPRDIHIGCATVHTIAGLCPPSQIQQFLLILQRLHLQIHNHIWMWGSIPQHLNYLNFISYIAGPEAHCSLPLSLSLSSLGEKYMMGLYLGATRGRAGEHPPLHMKGC